MNTFSTEDDELLDITPNKTVAKPQPQTQAPVAPPPNRPVAAAVEDDGDEVPSGKSGKQTAADNTLVGEEVEFGDQELMKKGDGLDRIRPEKKSDKLVRFSPLAFVKPRAARSHYVVTKEGKSNRLCLATKDTLGYCCKTIGEDGGMHVVLLGLEYTNADPKGGYVKKEDGSLPPVEWKIGYLDLSRAQFRSLSGFPEDGTTVYDYDYTMALNGNRYEFAVKARAARWKKNPALAAEVEAACQKYIQDGGVKLAKKLGKKTSLLEWKALLAGAVAGAAEANLDNLENL